MAAVSSRPSDQRPEKPDDRTCWVDSEAQWAGVGWRNVADVAMQLRWLEWRDRRGTVVPVHASAGRRFASLHIIINLQRSDAARSRGCNVIMLVCGLVCSYDISCRSVSRRTVWWLAVRCCRAWTSALTPALTSTATPATHSSMTLWSRPVRSSTTHCSVWSTPEGTQECERFHHLLPVLGFRQWHGFFRGSRGDYRRNR